MSDLMPMYAPDKVKIVVLLPVEVAMKIEKRAKEKNTKVAKYAATMLYHDTSDDPWTEEDEARRKEIIDENFRRREAALAKRRAARTAKAANANRRAK